MELTDGINKQKSRKTIGPDGIPAKFILINDQKQALQPANQ